MLGIILCILTSSLHSEVAEVLDDYRFIGYTFQWSRGLYLSIGEPCTLWVYPMSNMNGVICAMGAENILDLSMELRGSEMNSTDEMPDDLPVIPFTTTEDSGMFEVIVTVEDVLFGSAADSVYVFYSLGVVDDTASTLDPALPDSAIQGE